MPRYLHEAELERRERIARLDAEEVEAEERAARDDRAWLTEFNPSRESAVMRAWHPEVDW